MSDMMGFALHDIMMSKVGKTGVPDSFRTIAGANVLLIARHAKINDKAHAKSFRNGGVEYYE